MTSTLSLNDVSLCIDTVGDPTEGSVVLLAGAAQSMDWWDRALCERIAAATGAGVVRFDWRDTGASTAYRAGEPGYRGADLAADVVALLDALGIGQAHLVGLSMGGGIAQVVARGHEHRVSALTLMSCTADAASDDLPGPTDEIRATFDDPGPEPDYDDPSAVVDWIVDGERPYAGTDHWDEDWVRSVAERVVERTPDLRASFSNHFMIEAGPSPERSLGDLDIPTLVLHGSADPLFPAAHGEALAGAIPHAELEIIDGLGHQQPPPALWDLLADRLAR